MDYTDIYKRGLAAGIQKGSTEAAAATRTEIVDDIRSIAKSDDSNKIKLSAILNYLKIDDIHIEETDTAPEEGGANE